MNISDILINSSTEIMSSFVRKFCKRRCVLYVAKDGLAPQHDTDQSPVRQMLKQFERKNKVKSKATDNSKSNDVCFRCNMKGHWASQCPRGHEPEWIAKQQCFLCNQMGHLKSDCPNKSKRKQPLLTKPPLPKRAWYYPGTTLPKLLSTLDYCNLSIFKCYEPVSLSKTVSDPRFFKQKGESWFIARKRKISGSKAATALGWHGKMAMLDYWIYLRDTLKGRSSESYEEENLAMLWGSMNEESALITYLKTTMMKLLRKLVFGF